MRNLRHPLCVPAAVLLAAALSGGCAHRSAAALTPSVARAEPARPDVHGDPLRLLPPSPALWLRIETAAARHSPHWESLLDVIAHNAGDALNTLERELGFDPLRSSDLLALALYPAAPGAAANSETSAYVGSAMPVFYARGGFDRDALIAAARACAAPEHPLSERVERGYRVYVSGTRAYVFPAPDVILIFDPALVRTMLRQLAGDERRSAASDARFDPLWEQAGGAEGAVRLAADLVRLRAEGASTASPGQGGEDLAAGLDQAVLRADGAAGLSVHLAAQARSEGAAQQLVATIDEIRQAMLRRFEIRLLGFSRLLNQGITAVNDGRQVRIGLEATEAETSRVLQSIRLLQALGH